MNCDNPTSILFDTSGVELSVTASHMPVGTKALLAAGIDSSGDVSYVKCVNGAVSVSGSVNARLHDGTCFQGTQANPLVTNPQTYYESMFGELRTCAPYTLLDAVNKYNVDPRLWGTQCVNSGTVVHSPQNSAITLSVTSDSGSVSRVRSNTFYRYQAGKSLIVKLSISNQHTGSQNQVKRWGFFDDNDGLFYQLSGSALSVVQRSSVSGVVQETVISQSQWTHDKFDGSGCSGINLNVMNGNIYEIHFQWLGVGNVRFYVDGHFAHEIENVNIRQSPYMRTAQLPVAIETVNYGASDQSWTNFICASVISQGGTDPIGTAYGTYTLTSSAVTTSERPVISIRPMMKFNNITNRMMILPLRMSVSTDSGRINYRVVMNASLTGSSWSSVHSTSGVEYDTSATTFTNGETLFAGFLPNNIETAIVDLSEYFTTLDRKLRVSAFETTSDVLTIIANKVTPGTTNVDANISWREVR